jgi:hypothetical protein
VGLYQVLAKGTMVEMRTFSVSGLFFAVFLVSTEASNNVISTVPEAVINLNFSKFFF